MPVPQSAHAKPFEHSVPEGWESSVAFFTGLSVVILTAHYFFVPDTTIESWAYNEAAARLRLKEEHGFTNFEFGKHYQDMEEDARKEKWEELSNKTFHPFKEEEEDDDDDDEDDDDDDDDDE
eukprot:CAMPEP_0172440176 /NCGR_PEP_ID=MMETSP1065-20121228/903_1 /TAXON_ID=265537 /ORGANISM="Amphiprora paludosa, Strain CCMP125" /LENGTH=121 /DNA_ID=CAMNT_0013188959 /DNA_START=253 /DNA_END=618 /DNA_ORIENTATION=-